MKSAEVKPVEERRPRNPEITDVDTMLRVVNRAQRRAKMKENLRYNRMIVGKIKKICSRIIDVVTLFFSMIGLWYSVTYLIEIFAR